MAPYPVYVPILKGKEGEFAAIEALDADIRDRVMPLIEVPPIPYDWANERPMKSLGQHIGNIADRLLKAWGAGRPLYLDLSWAFGEGAVESSAESLGSVLRSCREASIHAVPVIAIDDGAAYRKAAGAYHRDCGVGICVRLIVPDFDDDVDLDTELEKILADSDLPAEQVDILIDLDSLEGDVQRSVLVARSLLAVVPQPSAWRRLIVAASSFPSDLSGVEAAGISELPRTEWLVWERLQRRAVIRPDIVYADYAIAHPSPKELDPRVMRMSASIRYTDSRAWVIVKGRNVRQWGFDQYFDLAGQLAAHRAYRGAGFSWGDRYINECAARSVGPGNATTWRKVGTNHHITLVVRQLEETLQGI
jgi:hypothetical protein